MKKIIEIWKILRWKHLWINRMFFFLICSFSIFLMIAHRYFSSISLLFDKQKSWACLQVNHPIELQNKKNNEMLKNDDVESYQKKEFGKNKHEKFYFFVDFWAKTWKKVLIRDEKKIHGRGHVFFWFWIKFREKKFGSCSFDFFFNILFEKHFGKKMMRKFCLKIFLKLNNLNLNQKWKVSCEKKVWIFISGYFSLSLSQDRKIIASKIKTDKKRIFSIQLTKNASVSKLGFLLMEKWTTIHAVSKYKAERKMCRLFRFEIQKF